MGAAVGTLLGAAGALIASAWSSISAAAVSAALSAGLIAESYGVAVSAASVGLILGDIASAGVPVLGSLITGEALTITTVYTLTTLGASVAGLTATSALLGVSGGLVSLALGSSGTQSFPTGHYPSDILSGPLNCSLLDIINGKSGVQCRKKVRPQMWLDNRQERYNSMYATEEEVLFQSPPRKVQYKKRKATKSVRLGKTTKRVRRTPTK